MNFIGIDFSINYPAISVISDNKIEYYSFYRPEEFTKFTKNQKLMFELLSEIPTYNHTILSNKVQKTDNYQHNERSKLDDALSISNTIYQTISKYDDVNLGIEGVSYNSYGNTGIDLASYQFILRYILLYQNNISFDIISPTSIKKIAGKGNYNKNQMAFSYINNTINCETLDKCEVRKMLFNNQDLFFRNQKSNKVWEDIVDSYFIAKYLQIQKII